jgi:hypothetical protein
VVSNVGATGNTGGSASAGSVMAKLNKIVSDIGTLISNWTSTRAGYIDTIKTNTDRLTSTRATIIDNIGATGNTGGTTSAGTVMAKLNAILSKINSGVTANGWYAKYGTTITLASGSTTVWGSQCTSYISTGGTTVLTFIAPESGVYRIDAKGHIATNDNAAGITTATNTWSSDLYVRCITDYNKRADNNIVNETYQAMGQLTYNEGLKTSSKNFTLGVYLFKGEAASIKISGYCSATSYCKYYSPVLESYSVKYVKVSQ